jgi:hypothetical protein
MVAFITTQLLAVLDRFDVMQNVAHAHFEPKFKVGGSI